jgi:DNA-binding MarR family transcriptional regulator
MPTWQPDLAPLIDRVPRLYYQLRAFADELNGVLGVSASMRGVMTQLSTGRARTVPDLARERQVSRQHVQTVVNDLMAAGLARTEANPASRRSPLISLTDEGRRHLRLIREREAAVLSQIAPAISHGELAAAMRLFDILERELAERAARCAGRSEAQTRAAMV